MKSRHMDPETWLRATGNAEIDEAEVERLIEARAAARTARDFAEADRIRDQLAAEGVILQGPARQDPLAPCGVVTLRVFTASRTAALGRALWLIGDCADSLADYDAASDWGGRKLADSAPDGPDVFLSYAGEDEARARDLATALEQRGLSVFWDGEIPPGQTWHSYIGEALTNARCVVVGWSRHSVASQWVLEEASEGRDRRVLVPVLFEAVQPPFGFRAIQAANLLEWRAGRSSPAFDGLLRAVQKIVGGQTGSGTGPEGPRRAAAREPVPSPTVRLFCSYSHKDEELRQEFDTHVKLLQRQGVIDVWHDRQIPPGDEWKQQIDDELELADIVVLLVSADFLASDYCYEIEMGRALARHEAGEARVIPVIVSDVNWRSAPFGKIQALPKDGKAVATWGPDRYARAPAWRNVAEGIEQVAKRLRQTKAGR